MTDYHKHYTPSSYGDWYEIYDDRYGSHMDKFVEMFKVIFQDFPMLTYANIEVVRHGGSCTKGIYALRFRYIGKPPAGWIKCNFLEETQ